MNTILLHLLSHPLMLGQTTKPTGGDAPWWASGNAPLIGLAVIAMIFMFTSSGKARRAQDKQRKAMLDNLKRGDRVQTAGGILGSVVEVRENEVVIKVDESTNTKIRITRESIVRVTSEEPAAQTK